MAKSLEVTDVAELTETLLYSEVHPAMQQVK